MYLAPWPGEKGPTTKILPILPRSSTARAAPIGPCDPNASTPLRSGLARIMSSAVL
jgi:hypothetical protein